MFVSQRQTTIIAFSLLMALLSSVACTDYEAIAVQSLEGEGHTEIVLTETDEGGIFEFTSQREEADCSGSITVSGSSSDYSTMTRVSCVSPPPPVTHRLAGPFREIGETGELESLSDVARDSGTLNFRLRSDTLQAGETIQLAGQYRPTPELDWSVLFEGTQEARVNGQLTYTYTPAEVGWLPGDYRFNAFAPAVPEQTLSFSVSGPRVTTFRVFGPFLTHTDLLFLFRQPDAVPVGGGPIHLLLVGPGYDQERQLVISVTFVNDGQTTESFSEEITHREPRDFWINPGADGWDAGTTVRVEFVVDGRPIDPIEFTVDPSNVFQPVHRPLFGPVTRNDFVDVADVEIERITPTTGTFYLLWERQDLPVGRFFDARADYRAYDEDSWVELVAATLDVEDESPQILTMNPPNAGWPVGEIRIEFSYRETVFADTRFAVEAE